MPYSLCFCLYLRADKSIRPRTAKGRGPNMARPAKKATNDSYSGGNNQDLTGPSDKKNLLQCVFLPAKQAILWLLMQELEPLALVRRHL